MNERSDTRAHAGTIDRTSNPCPAWCDVQPGHGYDTVEDDGLTRIHSRDFGDVAGDDGRPVASVAMNAPETATPQGVVRVIDRPQVAVYLHGEDLTGPQARQLAAQLVEAAAAWEEATRA